MDLPGVTHTIIIIAEVIGGRIVWYSYNASKSSIANVTATTLRIVATAVVARA
jgi:hypothetical protein